MDDTAHQSEGEDRERGLGPRTIALLVGALVVSLVAGALLWGTAGDVAPTVADEASGCTVHALRFTVTDDPAEFARQRRFEQTVNTVPKPGYYERALDRDATLHAASHAYVVVFMRPGVDGDGRDGLRALSDAAVRTKAPVVVSERAQGAAFVALSRGYELSCQKDGGAQAAEVRRFAAQEYASVADPNDAGAGPAPTSPHDAPSPAQP